MKNLNQKLKEWISLDHSNIAIESDSDTLSYYQLATEVDRIKHQFKQLDITVLAINMHNCPAWIVSDLAALSGNISTAPIPTFFSEQQFKHLLKDAQVSHIISDTPCLSARALHQDHVITIHGKPYYLSQVNTSTTAHAKYACKLSYTSGTTAAPKGVKINPKGIAAVTDALISTLNLSARDRHLCAMPLSLLLENIAGVYSMLSACATVLLADSESLGMKGSSAFCTTTFINRIQQLRPTTLIIMPQMAKALVNHVSKNGWHCPSLLFIAVGGAHVSSTLIKQAQQLGIPLYQGYGLTELSSVVAINTPAQQKPNSVGKLLPHITYKCIDGELFFSGSVCSGYVDKHSDNTAEYWRTGDLGYVDEDGFLFITGRKKLSYCTAYGRNVSPEWLEAELQAISDISQALVFGENQPFNIAIFVTAPESVKKQLKEKVGALNKRLPDYARIKKWLIADEPFTYSNGQLNVTGSIKRDAIIEHYYQRIQSCYQPKTEEVLS